MSKRLDVVSVAEIARMFPKRVGKSFDHSEHMAPESVSRWIAEGVLVPDAVLACGPIFRRSTVVKFANRTGRELRYVD